MKRLLFFLNPKRLFSLLFVLGSFLCRTMYSFAMAILAPAISMGTAIKVGSAIVAIPLLLWTISTNIGSRSHPTPTESTVQAPNKHVPGPTTGNQSPPITGWPTAPCNDGAGKLSDVEKQIFDALPTVDRQSPQAWQSAVKKAVNDRLQKLDNKSLFTIRPNGQLEITQALIEILDLVAAHPDQAVRDVLHHLMHWNGSSSRTSKCFDAILYKALQKVQFKEGYSAAELVLSSNMPYAEDCVYGKKGIFSDSAFEACANCQKAVAEALSIAAEKIDSYVASIRSIIAARNANDPRLIKLPSKNLADFLRNQFYSRVLSDYIRTGYCSVDPMVTPDRFGCSATRIINRAKIRKEIDNIVGATPAQSTALAPLNYELVAHAGDPRAQAQILLEYCKAKAALPGGATIEEIYFDKSGRCKIPWVEAAIKEDAQGDVAPECGSCIVGSPEVALPTCGTSQLDEFYGKTTQDPVCDNELGKAGNISDPLDIAATCGSAIGRLNELPKTDCNPSKERTATQAPPQTTCNYGQQTLTGKLSPADLALGELARGAVELKPGKGGIKGLEIPKPRYTIPEAEQIIEDAKEKLKEFPWLKSFLEDALIEIEKAKIELAQGKIPTNFGHVLELEVAMILKEIPGVKILEGGFKIHDGGLNAEFDFVIEVFGKIFIIECKSFDWLKISDQRLNALLLQIKKHYDAMNKYKTNIDNKLGLNGRSVGYIVLTPDEFPSQLVLDQLPQKEKLLEILADSVRRGYRFLGFNNLRDTI